MTGETMKKKLLSIALVLAILLVLVPANAQTITMANPAGIAERDIIVYWPNGTMYGFYNSTSVISLDPGSDYIFTMKPLQVNPLEDPGDWMTSVAFPFLSANVLPIVLGIGMLLAVTKKF